MAGKKGASGGARQGAGRKPKGRKPDTPIPSKFKDIESVYGNMQSCDIPLGECPKDIAEIPLAKAAWDYAIKCDEESTIHLLNKRHFEALKNYCIAVAQRSLLIEQWKKEGYATTVIDDRKNIKIHPLMKEIDNKAKLVNEFAEALGLTVLGEYKLAKTNKTSPKLMGDKQAKSDDDSDEMFD